jgi:hypothetical protein
MIRAAVTIRQIAMTRQNDLRLQLQHARDGCVKVGYLKPQQHAVSTRDVRIGDWTVVMFDIEAMQLKYQSAVRKQPFILWATVTALASKELLIPATARFNLVHADKWLWTHRDDLGETFSTLREAH